MKKIKYLDETKIGILSHNETNDAPLISSVVFLYMTTKPEQTGDGHQWIEQITAPVIYIEGFWLKTSADAWPICRQTSAESNRV